MRRAQWGVHLGRGAGVGGGEVRCAEDSGNVHGGVHTGGADGCQRQGLLPHQTL